MAVLQLLTKKQQVSCRSPAIWLTPEFLTGCGARSPTPILYKTMAVARATVLLSCLGLANAGATELTAANFDDEVAGKGAFIKFQAPW